MKKQEYHDIDANNDDNSNIKNARKSEVPISKSAVWTGLFQTQTLWASKPMNFRFRDIIAVLLLA